MKLLIMADDFTGALDTGIKFSDCGIKTRVMIGSDIDFASVTEEILVVDTETRHLTPKKAYEIVERIVIHAVKENITYIYKKTDSALRGNVGSELEALWKASGKKMLPFLPAMPKMDRVTIDGIHYISGVPVTQSPFGLDPFEPVKFDRILDLIAEQSKAPVYSVKTMAKVEDWKDREGICVFDAKTDADLEESGKRLFEQEKLHVMAGCSGFASILPELLEMKLEAVDRVFDLNPRLLVICGSVNPITKEQINEAEKAGFMHKYLTTEQKIVPEYWKSEFGRKALMDIGRELQLHEYYMIDSNEKSGSESILAFAYSRGLKTEEIRQGISDSIGTLVGELFTIPSIGTMLITGGDTLLQCMKHIGVYDIEPMTELENGVVLSKFNYRGSDRYVISKSGGFGERTLLLDLAKKLKNMQTNQTK
ncbi:MAG: four-carbon acid sugar kinase family protein [Lachnospiraceae bacterium]